MKRRRFFSWLSFSTLVTLLPAALSACSPSSTDSSTKTPETSNTTASQRQDGFIEVGQVQELEQNGSLSFKSSEGKAIVVVQDAETPPSLYALDSVCTHQGCTVNWDDQSKALACPCHGSKFDTQGQVVSGPAKDPIKSYPIKVEADTIFVSLS